MAERKEADGVADVFISYHEKSAGELVAQIADALEEAGISCWYAKRDMKLGFFPLQITRAIRACKVFLVILNEQSIQSYHVGNEVGIACQRISKHQRMELFPLCIDDCDFSDTDIYYYLNRYHVIKENPPNIQGLVTQITEALTQLEQMPTFESNATNACYIATSIYHSYNCPEVWTLRRFRDQVLESAWYGRLFIRFYYAISPKVVKLFGKADWFQRFWRKRLDKMVAKLQSNGFSSAPYDDLPW